MSTKIYLELKSLVENIYKAIFFIRIRNIVEWNYQSNPDIDYF